MNSLQIKRKRRLTPFEKVRDSQVALKQFEKCIEHWVLVIRNRFSNFSRWEAKNFIDKYIFTVNESANILNKTCKF